MSEQEEIRLNALQAENEALRKQIEALQMQKAAVEELNKELSDRAKGECVSTAVNYDECFKMIGTRLLSIEAKLGIAQQETLNSDEVAVYIGRTKDTVHRLTSKRLIPHYKRHGLLYFDRNEIDRWLKTNPVKTQEEIAQEAETYCALNKH